MSAGTFRATILTPDRMVFDGQVASMIVPGAVGYMGILAHHAPLISSLVPGTLTVRAHGETAPRTFLTQSGFLEVSPEGVSVLLDGLQPPPVQN